MRLNRSLRIIERYEATVKSGRGTEADVFRNPTAKEYLKLVTYDSVRCYLLDQDAICWNASSLLHGEMREELGISRQAIPLLLYGRPRDICYADVTDASRNTPWWHHHETAPKIRIHPWMRRMFTQVDVSYYDEDIVGDWENLIDDE